jgi:hypothetical protein
MPAKAFRLGDQLFLCQGFQIFVQVITFLKPGAVHKRCATVCAHIVSQDSGRLGLAAKGRWAADGASMSPPFVDRPIAVSIA